MVGFLAFWSLQGPGFTWCFAGNGLESVSSSHMERTKFSDTPNLAGRRALRGWSSSAEPLQAACPVTPEVEAELRRRLETFDEDAKAARPWQDVLADLKARRPLPQSPR
jgi:hypothetical protein